MSSSLLFLPATETVYRFLTSLSVSVHINHRRWDWLWSCFGKRSGEPAFPEIVTSFYGILTLHDVYLNGKQMILLPKNMETCFSGAAQGSQPCVGFLLCFWKCGKYKSGHPRDRSLRDGICWGPATAAAIKDFLRSDRDVTWESR